jgi:hypothetical protein
MIKLPQPNPQIPSSVVRFHYLDLPLLQSHLQFTSNPLILQSFKSHQSSQSPPQFLLPLHHLLEKDVWQRVAHHFLKSCAPQLFLFLLLKPYTKILQHVSADVHGIHHVVDCLRCSLKIAVTMRRMRMKMSRIRRMRRMKATT